MSLSGAFVAPLAAPLPIALEEAERRTISPEDTIHAMRAAIEALDPASLPSGLLEQARGILSIFAASDKFDERCEAYHGRQAPAVPAGVVEFFIGDSEPLPPLEPDPFPPALLGHEEEDSDADWHAQHWPLPPLELLLQLDAAEQAAAKQAAARRPPPSRPSTPR